MALDNAKNFAKATVSTGYDAASTSVVLSAGHGAKLPTAPFNLTWWNVTDYPDPADDPNVEIVRCTAVSTDTLTIVRAQESTSASTKNTAGKTYKMVAGLTAKVLNSDLAPLPSAFTGDFFIGPGLSLPMNGINTAKATLFGLNTQIGANGIVAVKFFLTRPINISKVTWSATDVSAGSHVSFGLYNTALTKVLDSGLFDGSISTSQTRSITSVPLSSGLYWLAMTATDLVVSGVSAINVTTGNFWSYINNGSVKIGVAANAATAGVLPSSLGNVNSTVGSSATTYWMPIFE